MARFSFRPSLTLKGRKSKGLRGFTGKPFHPPLTDVPIGAYVLAAAFDVISLIAGDDAWGIEFYRAATFALVAGAIVSLGTALTGALDWAKSAPKGTQARRTANAHGITMLTVTAIVLVDILLRLTAFNDEVSAPVVIVVLTVVATLLMIMGAAIGGSLVFDYGFNVKTAGDSPAWHESEVDLMPGQKPAPSGSAGSEP
ncbi:MAG: DUF2231 domain-containing protein [Actinomycetota bacterium]